jgi:hypothetical protein
MRIRHRLIRCHNRLLSTNADLNRREQANARFQDSCGLMSTLQFTDNSKWMDSKACISPAAQQIAEFSRQFCLHAGDLELASRRSMKIRPLDPEEWRCIPPNQLGVDDAFARPVLLRDG